MEGKCNILRVFCGLRHAQLSWFTLTPLDEILKFSQSSAWRTSGQHAQSIEAIYMHSMHFLLLQLGGVAPPVFFCILVNKMHVLGDFWIKTTMTNIVAICTTDVWDHIIFYSQYVVTAPPKPNFCVYIRGGETLLKKALDGFPQLQKQGSASNAYIASMFCAYAQLSWFT